jgi:hypothetical protein
MKTIVLNQTDMSCDFVCIMIISWNGVLSFWSRKKSHIAANQVTREGVEWHFILGSNYGTDKKSEQVQGMNLVTVKCMFRSSFRMIWTNPHEIPIVSGTSWLLVFLFLRSSFFVYSTRSSVLLVVGHPEHSASLAEVSLLLNFENHSKMCAVHFRLTKSSFQLSVNFYSIFPKFKAKLDTGKFQVCHFLDMPES